MPVETLEAVVGPLDTAAGDGTVRAPGMLSRHYAPSRPLRLDARTKRPGEAFLAFGSAGAVDADLNLSAAGDLAEAAANLFAMMRALDRGGAAGIAVAPVPETGLGRAINDRLRRAAAPEAAGGGIGTGPMTGPTTGTTNAARPHPAFCPMSTTLTETTPFRRHPSTSSALSRRARLPTSQSP